jgi:hypothetical protein
MMMTPSLILSHATSSNPSGKDIALDFATICCKIIASKRGQMKSGLFRKVCLGAASIEGNVPRLRDIYQHMSFRLDYDRLVNDLKSPSFCPETGTPAPNPAH